MKKTMKLFLAPRPAFAGLPPSLKLRRTRRRGARQARQAEGMDAKFVILCAFAALRENHSLFRPLAALCLSVWLSAPSFAVAAPLTLTLRPSARVVGATVPLRELVADASALPASWGERDVLESPPPGKIQQFPLTAVAYALQKYPDMSEVIVRGNARIAIQREGRRLAPEKIAETIVKFVESNEAWRNMGIKTEVGSVPDDVMVGFTEPEIKVAGFEFEHGGGGYLFHLEICFDGAARRALAIPAKLFALGETWVATRVIEAGATLTEKDMKPRKLTLELNSAKAIPTSESIEGYETSRQILADEAIMRSALVQPVCAERGSYIAVIAAKGGVEISVRARALEKGRRGDKIKCVNEQSQRHFQVQLISPGRARLIGASQAGVETAWERE